MSKRSKVCVHFTGNNTPRAEVLIECQRSHLNQNITVHTSCLWEVIFLIVIWMWQQLMKKAQVAR